MLAEPARAPDSRSFVVLTARAHRWGIDAEQVIDIRPGGDGRLLTIQTDDGPREVPVGGALEIRTVAASAMCAIPIRPLRAVGGWQFEQAVIEDEQVLFLVGRWVGEGTRGPRRP